MSKTSILLLCTALSSFMAASARADGGDREPAGGAFMSSYSRSPYASPQAASPYASPAYVEPETTGTVPREARPRSRARR